jgi:hypothetical protein
MNTLLFIWLAVLSYSHSCHLLLKGESFSENLTRHQPSRTPTNTRLRLSIFVVERAMSCFSEPSSEESHPVKHQLRPSARTFNKGSLLARLEQGEPLKSIKANMTYMPLAPKKKRRKLKSWLGFSSNAVELPAEDVPRKVELPGDVSAQKKFTELDSKARIELPINPSKEARRQEESDAWFRLMEARRQK